jgi:hypothetical protein
MALHAAEVPGYTLTQLERDESRAGKARLVTSRIFACVQLGEKDPKTRAEREAGVKVLKKAGFELVEITGTLQLFVLTG